jgi:hypothetical protein
LLLRLEEGVVSWWWRFENGGVMDGWRLFGCSVQFVSLWFVGSSFYLVFAYLQTSKQQLL